MVFCGVKSADNCVRDACGFDSVARVAVRPRLCLRAHRCLYLYFPSRTLPAVSARKWRNVSDTADEHDDGASAPPVIAEAAAYHL